VQNLPKITYIHLKTRENVAQVQAPVNHLDKVVEQLTIRFTTENSMIIEWDQTQVTVPVNI